MTKTKSFPCSYFKDLGSKTFPSANSSMSTFSIIALLLSVFNIIDMLVSNANNNNNRNNINQNDFNANDNSNTESNANPDQASSNAVNCWIG